MIKYYYYFSNSILRKVFLSIFLRKIKKTFKLTKHKPFNFNDQNIFSRKKVFNEYFNIYGNEHPKNIYKKLYINQKNKVLKNPHKFGGGADQELLFNLCKQSKIINILETGVASGWSTLAILLAINNDSKKKLVSLDIPYPYKNSSHYIANAVPEYLKNHQWSLKIGIDIDTLQKMYSENLKFDLVHYDSDKSYYGRYWFYKSIWPHIKKNGLLISDDVKDNYAFFDFARLINKKYYLIKNNKKYSGLIIK